MAESLKFLVKRLVSLNLTIGIQINNSSVISHLQFADDTLIFWENNESNLANIKRALHCLHLISGLEVNFHESSFIGVGVQSQEFQRLATVVHTSIGSLAAIWGCLYGQIQPEFLGDL